MQQEYLFYFFLIAVAFLYSSVGHGGASGYLALMAICSFPTATMKTTALILNICVSLIAFSQYYPKGYFKWRLFLPFAVASVPTAFLGGLLTIDTELYKKVLAILLIFPIIKLAGFEAKAEQPNKKINIYAALIIGAAIGFFSGMIGIGGGIILSPVILLLHWANMKQSAAISSLFIFVNSISGLAGQFGNDFNINDQMGMMIVVALAGGIAGSYFGAKIFESIILKRILASVLVIASVKLFTT